MENRIWVAKITCSIVARNLEENLTSGFVMVVRLLFKR